MNKVILVLLLIVLALSAVNTTMLVVMGMRMKEASDHMKETTEKIAPALKEIEKMKPALRPPGEKMDDRRPGHPEPPFPPPFPRKDEGKE